MSEFSKEYTKKQINDLIGKTDSDIINTIGMANLPLIVYVFEKKYLGQVNFIDIGGDCMIRYGSSNIANMSYLATHLHFLTIDKGILTLEGNISLPQSYKDRCKHYIQLNNKEIPLELHDAGLDQTIEGEIYESRLAFKISLPMSDYINDLSEELSISFVVYTDGIRSICGKINSYRFMPVADVIPNQYAYLDEFIIRISGNILHCKTADEISLIDAEEQFIESVKSILKDEKIINEVIELREKTISYKNKPSRVWLFMDRLDKADDNGEVFFRYVVDNKPQEVECFFIIDGKCDDYKRLQSSGNVVSALSYKHKELLLIAEYIFTSQMNGFAENPFGELSELYRDLYHRPRLVFLQHGVTKDDQSRFLNHFSQNMYSIVTSSDRELSEFLRAPYGLTKNQIWNTGMPRFDRLSSNKKRTNRILIMPTWRKSLMSLEPTGTNGIKIWKDNGQLKDSKYLRAYNSLMDSSIFHMICFVFGCETLFIPHPLMKNYEGLFKIPEWIHIPEPDLSFGELFSNCDILITDYSSVAFDVAYIKKRIIYYQFDRENFFKEHTYSAGYFNYYNDGFGPVCRNQFSLLKSLFVLLFNLNQNSKYAHRIDAFFSHVDNKCCKRLLDCIMQQ